MPQCGRGCQCAHAQALALELTRTELKCMAKYRYWLHVAVEGQTILCLLCRLMKAIVVMHQETHHSGGISLCILIITECFAQNLEGIASADLSPLFAATVLISSKQHNIF